MKLCTSLYSYRSSLARCALIGTIELICGTFPFPYSSGAERCDYSSIIAEEAVPYSRMGSNSPMSAEVRVLPRCVRAFSVADSSSYAQCLLTERGV